MKLFPTLLTSSLAANAILLGVFLFHDNGRHPSAASSAIPNSDPAAQNLSPRSPTSSAQTETVSVAPPFTHAALNSAAARLNPDDLASILAWLRASGFPPRAHTAIISQLVAKHFQARQEAANLPPVDPSFWKNPNVNFNDPKLATERVGIRREQLDLLKQLLGDKMMDFYRDSEEARANLRREIGDLPADKLSGLTSIEQDYALMVQELRASAGGGVPSPADLEKLAVLEKEHRADIAKLLTPEELAEFQLRYGPTSTRMRRDLALFQPSEAEYRALFPILDSIEQQFPSKVGIAPETVAARRAAEEKLQGQIMAVLGAERYEQFKQSTDPANAQISRLVARLDLPLAAAVTVANTRTEAQQRSTEIRNNPELTAEARTAQLIALANEATAKISTALGGPRGLDAYKEYGGQWLTNLTPRPATAPKN